MLRKIIPVIVALSLFQTTGALAQIRLAVLGAEEDKNLAALVTARFSKAPDVEMVEREEIARIAAELQNFSSHETYKKAGALFRANGLIVLTRDANMATARLVAVEPGVIVASLVFPVSENVDADAVAIQTKFAPLLPKLKMESAKKAVAISLLGLKFDVDSLQSRAIENQLNRLLADRLTYEQNFFVLERWRMESLVWEKGLDSKNPAPFWTGSYLLEGTLNRQNQKLTLSVHLKKADATITKIQLAGSEENLPDITEKLVEKIKSELKTSNEEPLPWDKTAEANNYAQLAGWALKHNLYTEAISAIESAIALGLDNQGTRTIQIRAYSMLALPDKSQSYTKSTLRPYLETAAEVAALSIRLKQKGIRFGDGSRGVICRVLQHAHEIGYHLEHPAEVAALRTAVREIMSLYGFSTENMYWTDLPWISYWTDTPEESLAVFKAVFARPLKPAGECGPMEDIRGKTYGDWRLAEWSPEQKQRHDELWRGYIDELKSSPSLQKQIDGMMLEYRLSKKSEELREPICDFLWKHRAEIFSKENPAKIHGLGGAINGSCNASKGELSFAVQMLCYMFQEKVKTDDQTWLMLCNVQRQWNEEEAKTLLPLLNAAIEQLPPSQESGPKRFGWTMARRDILRQYPALVPQETVRTNEFVVSRFWDLSSSPALKDVSKSCYFNHHLRWIDGRLWFVLAEERSMTTPRWICGADPFSADVVAYQWPEKSSPGVNPEIWGIPAFDVTPENIFTASQGEVLRCNRATREWKRIDVPPYWYKVRAHGTALYLTYLQRGEKTESSSGMLKVNLTDDTHEVVFSSRRIPPQHPLDGIGEYDPEMFQDGKGNIYFWLKNQIYQWSEERKNWEPEFSISNKIQYNNVHTLYKAQEGSQGAVLMGRHDQIVLRNPDSERYELLLENPEFLRRMLEESPRWECPPELYRKIPGYSRVHQIAWNNGALWILAFAQKHGYVEWVNFELFAFLPGRKTAAQIPLRFSVPAELGIEKPSVMYNGFFATEKGLVFAAYKPRGCWFLPYEEIPIPKQ